MSEAEAMSPGGGARICCLSHRVAQQDTQIGESFIPFSALTSGKDYTETLVREGRQRYERKGEKGEREGKGREGHKRWETERASE